MLREEDLSSFGAKLKSTRENMGISAQEAGSRLHLSPRFIAMLENENLLQTTLPPIYLRGYLRSYTRLLNIPEKELTPILEILHPKPLALDPVPPPSTAESLSLTFPLENNLYYARITTFIISLALLTSITAWWYLHANKATPAIVALDQPLINDPAVQPSEADAKSTPLDFNNDSLLQTAAQGPEIEKTKVPEALIDLAATKPVAVALASASTAQNTPPLMAKPAAKSLERDDDSASTDEQE